MFQRFLADAPSDHVSRAEAEKYVAGAAAPKPPTTTPTTPPTKGPKKPGAENRGHAESFLQVVFFVVVASIPLLIALTPPMRNARSPQRTERKTQAPRPQPPTSSKWAEMPAPQRR